MAERRRASLPWSRSRRQASHVHERLATVPFWWHSIDLGHGVVTPGYNDADYMRRVLDALRLPSLEGQSVLDIGAWDGYFSFEAERRGARPVVALDHYAWSLDYGVAAPELGLADPTPSRVLDSEVPEPLRDTPAAWRPDTLPGKRGFDVARELLGSGVEEIVGDFMDMDLDELGSFDLVLYLGVLYHMENPLAALRRVASVTRRLAVIETAAVVVAGAEDHALCEFYESDELQGDVGNWWAPNAKALTGLCRAAGFSSVELLDGHPYGPTTPETGLSRHRAIAHAWK